MVKARSKWQVRVANPQVEEKLRENLKLDPLLARLLSLRGITSVQQAKQFLFFDPPTNHDPFLFRDMSGAVKRIRQAIECNEKIRIVGDYDADGVSSTALLSYIFKTLGAHFEPYIPHRMKEGYGLNPDIIEQAIQDEVKLLITVDTGISAVHEIDIARNAGIDVIITDHHEPPTILPNANFTLNPKVHGCGYPFEELAGVGVVAKLGQALLGELPQQWYQLVAIGTVADLMPLVDENRYFVHLGVNALRKEPFPGTKALMQVAKMDQDTISAYQIGFGIGPRINASGRLDAALPAYHLYMSESDQEAQKWAQQLDQTNVQRQELVQEIVQEAEAMVSKEKLATEGVLILHKVNWPLGVVGIAAARITELFQRPSIVMSEDPAKGIVKGSARAPVGIDLIGMLRKVDKWFTHYGGHRAAAGMTLKIEDLNAFKKDLNQVAFETYGERLFHWVGEMDVDLCAAQIQINSSSLYAIEKLEPFGQGNPRPLILWPNQRIEESRWIGTTNNHLKLKIDDLDMIKFNAQDWQPWVEQQMPIAIVGEPHMNHFRGKTTPQIMIKEAQRLLPSVTAPSNQIDLKNKSVEHFVRIEWDVLERNWKVTDSIVSPVLQIDRIPSDPLAVQALEKFLTLDPNWAQIIIMRTHETFGNELSSLPEREHWAFVYRMFRSEIAWQDDEQTWGSWENQSKLKRSTLKWMLDVCVELEWASKTKGGWQFKQGVVPKREFKESATYCERLNEFESQQNDMSRWSIDFWRETIHRWYQTTIQEAREKWI